MPKIIIYFYTKKAEGDISFLYVNLLRLFILAFVTFLTAEDDIPRPLAHVSEAPSVMDYITWKLMCNKNTTNGFNNFAGKPYIFMAGSNDFTIEEDCAYAKRGR